ncbi:Hypothetical predicted protein [Pelobates cultripes]|uniref:Uncharacterized protein n=1 Tax=Pelobates cultripes TaxID=61616 RepID=A0AAD1TK75_PELCU|nr:Hypothetical predicted protein [Pelobates cultripes]
MPYPHTQATHNIPTIDYTHNNTANPKPQDTTTTPDHWNKPQLTSQTQLRRTQDDATDHRDQAKHTQANNKTVLTSNGEHTPNTQTIVQRKACATLSCVTL